jgi:hypothetical protein
MNESPITNVRRASRRREVMICSPLMKMIADVNSVAAPMTGAGITRNTALAFGMKASRTKMPPMA